MKKYVLVLSIFCLLVAACQRTASTLAAQPSQMPAATPTQPPPTPCPPAPPLPGSPAPRPTRPPPTLVPPPTQPPAGDPYADRVVHFSQGNPANADLDDPQTTLGPPDFDETTLTGFLTLGVGGSVTVEFVDNVAVDGPGPDIEIAGDPDDDDQWIAEVSADGVSYSSFGRVRERVSLDLATVGLASARFVRLTDDGNPAGGVSPGAELDAVLALNSAAPEGSPPPTSAFGAEVRIGVVYPLSGRLQEWGEEGLPFIQMAETDINNSPEATAAGVRFRFIIRSSDTTEAGALAAVQDLVENEGVQVIAGLPTSGELAGAMDYLAQHRIATISSSSTSPQPSLMMPDTVFRIAPTELYSARRLAEFAMHLGYRKAATIHRADLWGNAYAAEFATQFAAQGYPTAQVSIPPTHPHVTDYAVEVSQLSARVAELGADEELVVIVVVWEGEDLNILHHAAQDPTLSRVRWLSAVLYPSLLTGDWEEMGFHISDARDFALARDMWGQEFRPASNALVQRLWAQARADLGREPRFEHVYLYDALQIAARAVLLAGTEDGGVVAASIPAALAGYDPATGPIRFDQNGDRASGDLAYHGLFKSDAGYEYRYYAYYHDDVPGGRFEVLPQPEPREIQFCPEC